MQHCFHQAKQPALYSLSKPLSSNFKVRLFSVTVRTTCSGVAVRDVDFNLQGQPDVGSHNAG